MVEYIWGSGSDRHCSSEISGRLSSGSLFFWANQKILGGLRTLLLGCTILAEEFLLYLRGNNYVDSSRAAEDRDNLQKNL
jgi:hypothetical protein